MTTIPRSTSPEYLTPSGMNTPWLITRVGVRRAVDLAVEPVQLFTQLFEPRQQVCFVQVARLDVNLYRAAQHIAQGPRPGALDVTERVGDSRIIARQA